MPAVEPRMLCLTDYDPGALAAEVVRWGCVPTHAMRLLRNLYQSGGEIDWERLRLGRALEARLREEIPLRQSAVRRRHQSADGTIKLLIGLERGGAVESVLMPDHRPDRAAGCISSQIGCAMGCDFCASTKEGLERNLSTGEIVEQFLHLRAESLGLGRRLATIVFMGMGEPLLNFDAVVEAVRRITEPRMAVLGGRQVTISTVGIVPGIDRLAGTDLSVQLALSLHAPDDETRSFLVPANRRWDVADVMAAVRRFSQRTGRPASIEYCLLKDVNDSDSQASRLADLLEGFRVHVNLIRYNPNGPGMSGREYEPATDERVSRFHGLLRTRGVAAHVRRSRGQDVAAACGQLRRHTPLV